jgi:maleylacetoacetate isomerase
MAITLYSYWRSSASYRVRIALNVKGLPYRTIPVSLVAHGGEHRMEAYRSVNPQMLVPFFDDGQVATGQSMAILEYLEETYPLPRLLPESSAARARVRAFCNVVCSDIHPLDNLRVMQYLEQRLSSDADERAAWYAHWIVSGFDALEALLAGEEGPYAFGAEVSLADTCLVPQVYNARRFNVPLEAYPRLVAVADACNRLPAFEQALPERQPDAPG